MNLQRRGMQSLDCNGTLKYVHAQFGLKCAEYYYSVYNYCSRTPCKTSVYLYYG